MNDDYNVLDSCAPCVCFSPTRDAFDDAVLDGASDKVDELLRKNISLMKRRRLPSRRSAWHLAAEKVRRASNPPSNLPR